MSAALPAELVARFRRWYAAAERARQPFVDSMALATADASGRPAVRYVLLKGTDERGFVFYTNTRSRKGDELAANPRAALVFHWETTGRQVRIEGAVEPVGDDEADAYWATRPRGSRIAALASTQSAPLARRSDLLARVRRLGERYRGREVPRPAHWTGYRVVPDAIEFWTDRQSRLHERELFRRDRRGWRRTLLQP